MDCQLSVAANIWNGCLTQDGKKHNHPYPSFRPDGKVQGVDEVDAVYSAGDAGSRL
jgi:hypothetical protein